ncbi:hypothetical protein ACR6C2_35890 [Streptomyces sp. INA 01156]
MTLLSALFVLRDRCGRDWNPYLLAAFVLTALLAVVPLTAMSSTQEGLDGAIRDLRQITDVSRENGTEADAQQEVTKKSEEIRRKTAEDAWTAPVYQGTFVGSLLTVVLPALGLGLRLDNDYWRRR